MTDLPSRDLAVGQSSIALALGAGGARGCAHIGVIRGLERHGLSPIGVAGGSMGALVGALYALGAGSDELARLRLGARIRATIRLRLPSGGFLDPRPLIDLVQDLVGDRTFADTRFPLVITAVDLTEQQRVVLDAGDLATAVAASMMVPGVFPSCQVAGRWLNDPGIIESVPVDVAAAFGADTVLAVSADRPFARGRLSRGPFASPLFRGAGRISGAIGIRAHWPWATQLSRTLECLSRDRIEHPLAPSVVWIQPAFGSMNANQFGACDRAIELGEAAVRPVILRMRAAGKAK